MTSILQKISAAAILLAATAIVPACTNDANKAEMDKMSKDVSDAKMAAESAARSAAQAADAAKAADVIMILELKQAASAMLSTTRTPSTSSLSIRLLKNIGGHYGSFQVQAQTCCATSFRICSTAITLRAPRSGNVQGFVQLWLPASRNETAAASSMS